MRIKNLPSILSMNGSQDALVIEQTDGSEDKSRKVSPAQIKQYVLGNSIDDIYSVMGQNGAKNLIPYPYANDSITDHGVTFTVNNDGTVVANGTANGTAQLYLVLGNVSLSAAGNLVINSNKPLFLSGCPSGGGNTTYRIQYGLTDGTTYWAKTASDTGSGVKITPVDGLNSYCFDVIKIMVFDGYTVNNLKFNPMLRLAADTDDTYQPYAMTNKQLTNVLAGMAKADEVKEIAEAGDFEATGEVKDGHGNILKNMAKSADIATLLITDTYTTTPRDFTAGANGYCSVSGVSKSGYTVLGIIDIDSNRSGFGLTTWHYNSGDIFAWIRPFVNLTGITITFKVLFIKNLS